MKIIRYLAILIMAVFPLISLAATSVCTIEIEDINASVKNKTLEKLVVK